jgi:hypothetical protein
MMKPVLDATITQADGKTELSLRKNLDARIQDVHNNPGNPEPMLGYNDAFMMYNQSLQVFISFNKGNKDTLSYEVHNAN